MHPNQTGRCSCGRACDEMLNKTIVLRMADTTLSHSPLDTPKLDYLGQPQEEIAKSIRSGDKAVPDPKIYLAAFEGFTRRAAQCAGRKTMSAQVHGDPNFANLILTEDGVCGVDFGPNLTGPIGRDLSRFFIQYAKLFPDFAISDGRGLIRESELDAFFDGYGWDYRNDPSFNYLLPSYVLEEVRKIPNRPEDRNDVQVKTYQSCMRLMEKMVEF